jgi:hypothetical protein
VPAWGRRQDGNDTQQGGGIVKTKEVQESLVKNMQKWQQIERSSIASTGAVMVRTTNPLLQLVMEIIQHDSHLHHRVQQMIIDSIEGKPLAITPDDTKAVGQLLDNHMRLENEMVDMVNTMLAQVKEKKMAVQEYLLRFLVEDEKKHAALLSSLEHVKRGMFPT